MQSRPRQSFLSWNSSFNLIIFDMTKRFVCIHGHFYQPPRENPWLEDLEVQDSAAPYHDWNERITAECYAPNAVSRVLDGDGKIIELVSNYEKMSFNFGPTLLSWLQRHRGEVYKQIIDADVISRSAHAGHGNAIAQCYNHAIMPLASERDKLTQVRWGIADFQFRFGRKPEGMWLPETAVDLATLQVLAEHGIKFTILSTHQAEAVRAPGEDWHDVSHRRTDTTRAYRCPLKNGNHIDLFFYDAHVSHDISFESLLRSGDRLAERLASSFDDLRDHAQLVNVATDGETFGHHSKFGDMALAYAIGKIEREGIARITNYGEYLALYPPTHEVKISEDTSWSCGHGVERWRSDCGCNSGNTHCHQRWREPLRQALDWLRAKLNIVFEHEGSVFLKDVWAALDDYIFVMLQRSAQAREAFLDKHARRQLSEVERVNTWRLLEMQRHAALMYTSCGWFFDDISNIETVKNIEYAARSIQLAREASGADLEPQFIANLEKVPGSKPQLSDGAKVYDGLVKPSIANLKKGLAHYGISSLVEEYAPEQQIFSFEFDRQHYRREKTLGRTVAVGAVNVRSEITREDFEGMFVVLHLGGYDFHCVVRERLSADAYEELTEKLFRSFNEDSTRNLLRAIDAGVDGESFALKDLFDDERRKIGRLLLGDALERSRDHYRRIYEESRDVMRLLASMKIPVPETLSKAAEYVLTSRLEEATDELSGEEISDVHLREVATAVFREAETLGCKVDSSRFKSAMERLVYSRLESYRSTRDEARAGSALRFLKLAEQLDVNLDLWRLQNLFWTLLNEPNEKIEPAQASMDELGDKLEFSERVVQMQLKAGS
jgi:alpha-amylase/alpha-mannosidase (GH57 family)